MESRTVFPLHLPAGDRPIVAPPGRRWAPLQDRLVNHGGILNTVEEEDGLTRLRGRRRRNEPRRLEAGDWLNGVVEPVGIGDPAAAKRRHDRTGRNNRTANVLRHQRNAGGLRVDDAEIGDDLAGWIELAGVAARLVQRVRRLYQMHL